MAKFFVKSLSVILLSGAAAFALASPASAQNSSDVDQAGPCNLALVTQSDSNSSWVLQVNSGGCAAGNAADVDQVGTNDQTTWQFGRRNLAITDQDGDGNGAFTLQDGRRNESGTFQLGDNNDAFTLQDGRRDYSEIMQDGMDNIASVVQTGNDHDSSVDQNGDGNIAIVDQD